jgi:hypothetical protein
VLSRNQQEIFNEGARVLKAFCSSFLDVTNS